jgi:hypothetical protein
VKIRNPNTEIRNHHSINTLKQKETGLSLRGVRQRRTTEAIRIFNEEERGLLRYARNDNWKGFYLCFGT